MTATKPQVLKPGNIAGLEIYRPAEVETYLNALFYGDPGVGKTVLSASCSLVPQMSPVLVLDMEGGTLSLARTHPNVDVVRIRSFNEFNGIYTALRRGNFPYKTIVMDSITEIQKFGMYEVMKRMLLDPDNKDRDPDMPGIGEWGKNTEQVRKLVRAFRDLPLNTIVTALAMNEMTDSGVIRKSKPSLSAKLSNEIPGFFDIVGYMYIKEAKRPDPNDASKQITEQVRCLLTMATQRQVAKDRTGVLPPVIEHPTMESIYALVHPGDNNDNQQDEVTSND